MGTSGEVKALPLTGHVVGRRGQDHAILVRPRSASLQRRRAAIPCCPNVKSGRREFIINYDYGWTLIRVQV
jgi:hypothetical protein